MSVVLKYGNVYTYVTGDSAPQAIKVLRDHLRYKKDTFQIKNSKWNRGEDAQYTVLVTPKGRFLSGLAYHAANILKHYKIDFSVEDEQSEVSLPDAAMIDRRLNRMPFTLRPYQEEAVFKGLRHRRAMFDLATGAGKTVVIGAIIKVWDRKTMIVCDSKDLAAQLRAEIEEATSLPVGMIGDGKFEIEQVTVAMVSTLTHGDSGKKKKKLIQDYLDTVEHLIFDEVHHSQAATWQKVSRACKNASLRHGFSGTCFTPEFVDEKGRKNNSQDLVLVGHTGPIRYVVKTKDLVEMGYLSKPTVIMVKNEVYYDGSPLQYQDEYTRIISESEERNAIVGNVVRQEYAKDEQSIVFVDRLDHGERIIEEIVRPIGLKPIQPDEVEYVTGNTDFSTRKNALKDFKEKRLPVLVGTVLGEGLNFFAKAGVNAAGGKSKKNTIQKIGRVLRKDRDPETGDVDTSTVREVLYFDFLDTGHPIFAKHGRERMQIYKDEGHEVKVVRFVNGVPVKSGYQNMPIKGENLNKMYRVWQKVYQDLVGKWEWKPNEKGRVKEGFTHLCEAYNLRRPEEFAVAMQRWEAYLQESMSDWLAWDKSDRMNVLGFVLKRENMEVAAAKKASGTADAVDIAGTQSTGIWEF